MSTDRGRAAPVARTLAVIAASVMVVALPANFFWTYAFNDAVGWDDHRGFLLRVGAVVLVVSAIFAPAVRHELQVSFARGALGSLLVVGAIPLCCGSGYALLSLLPALDSAVGSEASAVTCAVVGAGLGAVAGAAAFASLGVLSGNG